MGCVLAGKYGIMWGRKGRLHGDRRTQRLHVAGRCVRAFANRLLLRRRAVSCLNVFLVQRDEVVCISDGRICEIQVQNCNS